MDILLLDGSSAINSHTAALLRHLQESFQQAGHSTELIHLRERALPINDPIYHDRPQTHPDRNVREFVARVAAAQAIVLGTPLYHGSFSGLMKSALDHLSDDAFKGKAIGIVSNAAGIRVSQQGAQQLVQVARTLYGRVSDRLIGTNKADYEVHDGSVVLTSAEIIERCKIFTRELLEII